MRRDIAPEAWSQELSERKPIADWKTTYSPTITEAKPEVTSKESAAALLQRFVEEDEPSTENARYILALMLERKRILSHTATKDTETGRMLFYENKKTGEVFIIRDPELRLDELAQMQDEVAMLLGFGGPAAEAAKVAGMKFTPDGKLVKEDAKGGKSEHEAAVEAVADPEQGTVTGDTETETAEEAPADVESSQNEETAADSQITGTGSEDQLPDGTEA